MKLNKGGFRRGLREGFIERRLEKAEREKSGLDLQGVVSVATTNEPKNALLKSGAALAKSGIAWAIKVALATTLVTAVLLALKEAALRLQ